MIAPLLIVAGIVALIVGVYGWLRERRQEAKKLRALMAALEDERFRIVFLNGLRWQHLFSVTAQSVECPGLEPLIDELKAEIDADQKRLLAVATAQEELEKRGVSRDWESVALGVKMLG